MLDGLPGPVPVEHIVFIRDKGRTADVIRTSLNQLLLVLILGQEESLGGVRHIMSCCAHQNEVFKENTAVGAAHMYGRVREHTWYVCGESRG